MQLLYPTLGKTSISQKYGNRGSFYSDYHRGVDFRTWQYKDEEDKKVLASHEGKVIFVDKKSTGNTYYNTGLQGSHYGVHCIIEFLEGDVKYYMLFAHMKECNVDVGQEINVGQILGVAGSSGLSTRAHLHFQLMKGENKRSHAIDPTSFFVEEIEDEIPEWAKEEWQWAKEQEISSDKTVFDSDVSNGTLMVFLNRMAKKLMDWSNSRNDELEKRIVELEKKIK